MSSKSAPEVGVAGSCGVFFKNVSSVFIQVRALMWKTWLIKKRSSFSSFCELFAPIIVGLFILWVRSLIKTREVSENILATYPDPSYQKIVNMQYCPGIAPNEIFMMSPDIPIVYEFWEWWNSSGCVSSLGVRDDPETIIKEIQTTGYEDRSVQYAGILIFEETGPTNWKYTIRVPINRAGYPEFVVDPYFSDFTDSYNFRRDVYSYTQIQRLLDEFIMLKSSNQTNLLPNSFYTVTASDYPYTSFINDPFFITINTGFVLLYCFAWLWPFTRLVKLMIEETESRLREGMKMMGLLDISFWFSWIFSYLILFIVIDIILTLMFQSKIFPNTAPLAIFLSFISYQISLIALAILIASVFKTSRTAIYVSVFGFFIGWVVYIFMANPANNISKTTQQGVCLFSPACLGFVTRTMSYFEILPGKKRGLTMDRWWKPAYETSFGDLTSMYVLDTLIYLVLAWYLDKIIKGDVGTRQPWYFPFMYSFWFPNSAQKPDSLLTTSKVSDEEERAYYDNEYFEEYPEKEEGNIGVNVRKLKREFNSPAGKFTAVNNIYLKMYNGEVFVLLGHNGAGKTTTISMLTGLIESTSGEVNMFGYNLGTDLAVIQQQIGCCPQQNVLFPLMTVKEHLYLFAALRRLPKDTVEKAVNEAIANVGLAEKVNVLSSYLSGGQKRKLCVAIAFLGNPKVVFLDEPTSGMDVDSRRATWDIIKKQKHDKVIILTTHFMDEADLLGDRIAIMAKGQVVCNGSSLFLKKKYGVGYTFVVSLAEGTAVNQERLLVVVKEHIPDVEVLNNIGGEMFFRVPLSYSKMFPVLFSELDRKKEELHILTYSVSATTLEEVFLKVGNEEHIVTGQKLGMDSTAIEMETKEAKEEQEKSKSKIAELMKQSGKIATQSSILIFFTHFYALVLKRFHYSKRDYGSLFCLWLLPTIFIILGLSFYQSLFQTEFNAYSIDLNKFPTPIPFPFYSRSFVFTGGLFEETSKYNVATDVIPVPAFTVENASDLIADYNEFRSIIGTYLLNEVKQEEGDVIPYGAIIDQTAFSEVDFNTIPPYGIWIRQTAVHGVATYLNVLSNSVLKTVAGLEFNISMTQHPLPLSARDKEDQQIGQALTFVLFITIAYAFVPATYITFIVQEKAVKAKHQQMISGISIPAYWISNFFWDLLVYMVLYILTLIFIAAFDVKAFTGGNRFGATAVVFFLYGCSVIPYCYLMSFLFKGPQTARISGLLSGLVFGTLFMIAGIFLVILTDYGDEIKTAFRFLTPFCLADGLYEITIAGSQYGNGKPFSNEHAGKAIGLMISETFVYLVLVMVIEYAISVPKVAVFFYRLFGIGTVNPVASGQLESDEKYEEDSDVQDERKRMQNGESKDDIVRVAGLRKVYHVSRGVMKTAVRDLWFSIPKGECFGFLGINGAGKTTTLSMLSGDIYPTSGTATLGGYDILSEPLKVRRLIGYCPQFDAIWDKMTSKEHLEFFARVKGVPERLIPDLVEGMLHYFTLDEYKNRVAGSYSGGNKRKLSVAMALMGDPQIVFLDEPSSGMDPVSRRYMWKFIAETGEGRAVILTTHAMEECEALCKRIGIMVDGRLRCLGSAQHIKDKFGKGYQLDVNTKSLEAADALKDALAPAFGDLVSECQTLEAYGMAVKFRIFPREGVTLARLFEVMEREKESLNIKEYALSQTSLEQIFIGFAKQAKTYSVE